jgi:uncharacterized membrane protein YbhN (UPF0104 family)
LPVSRHSTTLDRYNACSLRADLCVVRGSEDAQPEAARAADDQGRIQCSGDWRFDCGYQLAGVARVLADHFKLPQGYLTAMGLGCVAALFGGGAAYFGWLGVTRRKLQHLKVVTAIQEDLLQLLRAGWTWLPLIVMSFVFQLTAVSIVYLLFLGAGSNIGFAEVALIAAVTGLAGMLPLAINGIGVTEGSITLAGVALGADYEDAAVAAVLLRVSVLPLSCACGVLYWLESRGKSRDEEGKEAVAA